jgi:hypothetical protein
MYKIKIILALVYFIAIAQISSSQKIDSSFFASLKNKSSLQVKDASGKYLGCAFSLECRTMKIIFYDIECDKPEKKISIKGRIMDPAAFFDSLGVDGAGIFIAHPVKDKLTRIRNLQGSAIGSLSDSTHRKFPYRSGDFEIVTRFTQGDRLYFESKLYDAVEYDIGKLLMAK